jgi:hypothetical protein
MQRFPFAAFLLPGTALKVDDAFNSYLRGLAEHTVGGWLCCYLGVFLPSFVSLRVWLCWCVLRGPALCFAFPPVSIGFHHAAHSSLISCVASVAVVLLAQAEKMDCFVADSMRNFLFEHLNPCKSDSCLLSQRAAL